MAVSLRTKLAASIVVVVLAMGVVSTIVGIRLFADSLLRQVQRNVEQDLNTAYLFYENRIRDTESRVQLAAGDPRLLEALRRGETSEAASVLGGLERTSGLDFLTVTDARGIVVARGGNPGSSGDDRAHDEIVRHVLDARAPVSGTVILDKDVLALEAPDLVARARIPLVETPHARPTESTVLEDGMMLLAGTPIVSEGEFGGVVYGGVLLNRTADFVDEVKETAYAGETWKGREIGSSTLFLNDVRIATTVLDDEGARAVGTRLSAEVYDRVVGGRGRWVARAFVVDDWYITAYGPLNDLDGKTVGLIYVGVLAAPFDTLRTRTLLMFAAVSVAGMVLALIIASVVSSGIMRPIGRLAAASRKLAQGIDSRVEVDAGAADELKKLAEAFNSMAQSMAERDEQLRENARKMTETKKLATLGQLAAGIAHEINNPLGGIVMYSHMLREDLQKEENRANVEKIAKEADRCKKIVKGLLDFARQTKPERSESSLNHVLDEVIALLEHQAIFHNITIVKRQSPGLPLVDIDIAQIQEVFMNIVLNAAQAMEGKGTLTIVTQLAEDRKSIEVEIRDTGPGIRPEHKDKIFEPFFTTKEVGRGTGLGLAIAYGIIERHHGSIWVESELGKGASFFVRLPLPAAQPEM
jgi:two-component system NtrC family sensor kinase